MFIIVLVGVLEFIFVSLELGGIIGSGQEGSVGLPPVYVPFIVGDVPSVVVKGDGGAGGVGFGELDFVLSGGDVDLSDGALPPLWI